MYRSLPQLVEGWSKNILTGGLQTFPHWARPFVAPAAFLSGIVLWLVPPVALVLSLVGILGDAWLVWSTAVCVISVVLVGHFTRRMGESPVYGLLYPLGALVGTYIFLRSWIRGRHVVWKGRSYELPPMSERA
jgi:hypothetical protein